MLKKIFLAFVVAVVVALVCILLDDLFGLFKTEFLTQIGDFLGRNCGLIGTLFGLGYFVTGQEFPTKRI